MGISFILIALLGISFPVLATWAALRKERDEKKFNRFFTVVRFLSETFFVGVFPGIGIAISNDKCSEHPFENNSVATAYTLWLVFAVAFFLSRDFKRKLSPVVLAAVGSALAVGIVFCLFICIHFVPLFLVAIFPGFNLLFLSPYFSFFYLFRETLRLNSFFKTKLLEYKNPAASNIEIFNTWLNQHYLGFITILCLPLLVVLQAVLYLFGQRPDSIISQFTDSCGFLLSHYQSCSCGGDHYLCSIAANGNKKLVKPTRFGFRANERIIVNRQLLIANAFENWLEDHMPRLHRIIRRSYDSMNIPVNKWSKKKRFANALYIVMKPLEWLFLLWLYCLDGNPESRIAKQYLPKKELDNYLKSNAYENKN